VSIEYRALGATGVRVSRFGLGTMVLGAWGNRDLAECTRIVHRAIDAGVNLVDTADVYGAGENEEIVGRAIAGRRDDVVLATKFHGGMGDDVNRRGNSRRWMMRAIDDSLRRLGVDHVDLYQIHRPDPSTSIDETVGALDDLARAGKIRYWGTSTFPAEEIVEARWAAQRCGATGPHTEQPPYSILCRHIERDVLPACRRHGIGVLVWSPLSGGWLTGKYRAAGDAPDGSRAATNPDHFDGANEAKATSVDRLRGIAAEAGLSVTHLSLAWAAEHPAVSSVLLGPRTEEQLADLLGAADITLDADTLDAIDGVVAPGSDLNPADAGWTPPGLAARQRRRNMPETVRSYAPPDDGDAAGGDT
jgi:aryl-alcohol dehydrogenase-like predicted oxidoreductase